MPSQNVTVWQAEWCPYSSRVRQRLTELGVPYVAMPVEPEGSDRATMREAVGTDEIPVVVLDDGTVLSGDADEIVAQLGERFPEGVWAEGHRDQARAHS